MDPFNSSAESTGGSPVAMGELQQQVRSLERQLEVLVRVATLTAVLVALALSFELWSAWQRRPAAQVAGQMRGNLQQIASAAEEYRQAAARSPELTAIGRKYGIEPAAPSSPAVPR